jgi:putative ABC transport system substrate-binding protein
VKIPTIYPTENYTEAVGFASLGNDLADSLRLVASYIGKILKGANPGDLPVLSPQKTLITINTKAARELGITIPQHIQARLID